MSRLLFFTCLCLSACRQGPETKEPDPNTLRGGWMPTQVKTAPVTQRPFPHVIQASGRIYPQAEVVVMSPAAGIVKSVGITNGQLVRSGQTLAELENARQQIQLQRSQLTVEERKVTFQDMLMGHRGKKDSVVSKVVLQNIRLASGLAAAELAYQEALLDYTNTLIAALQDGVVSDWKLQPGSHVAAFQELGRIFSPGRFVVVCHLLEQDALRLTDKSTAELLVEGVGGGLRAHRPQVNPRVDNKTNLVEVTFPVLGTPDLIPGLTARLTIRVPGRNALVVPKEAVVFRSGKAVVFSLENGVAKWNYVKTGLENGREIEITEGLKENMTVIVTNNLQLAHDAPVQAM